MADDHRTGPPHFGTERETLRAFLDYHRATLAMKCEGLTDEELRRRSMPPSTLSLLGLVRHMAEVERAWFRRVFEDHDAPMVWSEEIDFQTAYDASASTRADSGEAADGTVLHAGTAPDGVRRARQLIDEGRESAGRTDPHQLIVYLLTATGPDAHARLHAELTTEGLASVPDLGAAGDTTAVAKAVQRLTEAGADTVILQPTADEPDPEGFIRFVAKEVRPLVPS
ncbi:mycothiol transferase [Streptomyces adelaidensis]|uniref:mycothiol transferase n=1 Tax=Streptomyces adelaidensis TaxID=2796465 RepID=UPI0027DBF8A4|nr:DUF664 domain-containing protein [Streptomyces adelaidensis]